MYPYNLRKYEDDNITKESVEIESIEKSKDKIEADNTTLLMNDNNLPMKDKILLMIEEAIGDELRDYEYYKRLQMLFNDAKDKETIRHISLDEMKHKKMLEELYNKLSSKNSPIPKVEDINITRNLLVELAKSIANEFDGVEFYRKLYFLFKNPEYKDMMFEILNDEHIHAGKLTYLYSKYK